jgi:hypothetical protein
MATTFTTNPVKLETLLTKCADGQVQLPDFQRSWVWDEDRIVALIASVSRGFPIGALMTLATRADGATVFARRPVEGARPAAAATPPEELLLDGQQRMTSLYQACMRDQVVATITAKKKLVRRWFYVDIAKALQPDVDRENAIVTVPEDRRVKEDFDRTIVLDLSKPEYEYAHLMFPLNQAFDWDTWREGFDDYWLGRQEAAKRDVFKAFRQHVLKQFTDYQVPVISLGNQTPHEAVCLVFEKVNTGGKALDAFELLTAMYAARGHKLRDDWLGPNGQGGIQQRLAEFGRPPEVKLGVLGKVAATDFLQAVALLHTKAVRDAQVAGGVSENDLSGVRATRQSLLDLPLEAYLTHRDAVEDGFKRAARFLRQQCVHRVLDLPYQTQLVPLAAIFATLGQAAEHAGHQAKLARWFWCGIFGELYGGGVESRFAKDIVDVPAWLAGGPEPGTVRDGVFRADRLFTMRTRLSAAYKGIHALLMREGAKDFRTGQPFDMAVFFDEDVDIHHIFPQDWCKKQGKDQRVWDSAINKTPLGYRTNRTIGGVAPSVYLQRLQDGRTDKKGQMLEPPISAVALDSYVVSHCVDAERLRADDFEGFIAARRRALLGLISQATGHSISDEPPSPDEGDDLDPQLAHDSGNDDPES